MVRAVENVFESHPDERHRGLEPAGVKPDEPGVSGEFVRANGPALPFSSLRGRQKAQHRIDARSEDIDGGFDGEFRAVGMDRIVEEHIEHHLGPDGVHIAL